MQPRLQRGVAWLRALESWSRGNKRVSTAMWSARGSIACASFLAIAHLALDPWPSVDERASAAGPSAACAGAGSTACCFVVHGTLPGPLLLLLLFLLLLLGPPQGGLRGGGLFAIAATTHRIQPAHEPRRFTPGRQEE